MLTATLFKSEYRDAQGQWHHSRHDRGYITNILGGKEWMVGRARKNVFVNVGYAFSVKYTINKRRTAHHFILEYLQMKTFQGQTFDLRTHEIVDKFTSLTFPNIAYRVEF